jgi:hypothetical protein
MTAEEVLKLLDEAIEKMKTEEDFVCKPQAVAVNDYGLGLIKKAFVTVTGDNTPPTNGLSKTTLWGMPVYYFPEMKALNGIIIGDEESIKKMALNHLKAVNP